jgi:hypothetical protein
MFSLLAAFSAPDGIGAMPTFVSVLIHNAIQFNFNSILGSFACTGAHI